MIDNHDGDIHRMTAELTDLQHAHCERQTKAELIVSGLPPRPNMTPDQIADALFAYLDRPKNIAKCHKAASRFVLSKNPQATTSSAIIRMLSHDACDIVLEAVAPKRKSTKLLVREILGGESESVFYVNKMQSQYVANLTYQAWQAKKRLS